MTISHRRIVAAVVVALLPSILLVLGATPALASNAGFGQTQCSIKYDKWVVDHTTVVATADPTDSVVRKAKMRHSPRVVYRWCRNGPDRDTAQFLAGAWCSRKLVGHEVPYVWGVKFNLHFYNNAGTIGNPPEDGMKWRMFAGKHWDQHCHYQEFKNSRIVYVSSHPHWKVSARVVIGPLMKDDHLDFTDRHYLGYRYDPNL